MGKECPKCKTYKEDVEFHKNSSSKNGLSSYCKVCRHNMDKERQLYFDQRKDIKKSYDQERQNNDREVINEQHRQYYRRNKEQIKIKHKDYYDSNKDIINDKKRISHIETSYQIFLLKDKFIRLKGGECEHCGLIYDIYNYPSFEFHHIDPKIKEFEISRMGLSAHSYEKQREEISKCLLLCSNCHRILHSVNAKSNIEKFFKENN